MHVTTLEKGNQVRPPGLEEWYKKSPCFTGKRENYPDLLEKDDSELKKSDLRNQVGYIRVAIYSFSISQNLFEERITECLTWKKLGNCPVI